MESSTVTKSMDRLSGPERFIKTLLYLDLVRGLVAQIVVSLIAYFATNAIRAGMGKPINPEPGVVVAGLLGFIAHMWAAGVFSDWFKWARGIETPMAHGPPSHMPAWMRYFNVDYNHKVIGIQYTVTGIIILLVGGLLAIIFRLELSFPGMQLLVNADGSANYDLYNTLFSAHGIIMIVAIFLGVGGMLNYLVPLMIGAADMAYPRLNAFSYWIMPPAAVLLLGAIFIGGWDTGWVAYPPLSTSAGQKLGVNLFLLGFWLSGFSSIAGAINVAVTVIMMRAKGMTMWRVPIFIWASLATVLIQGTVTQTVGLSLMMVLAQRHFGLGFFDPTPIAGMSHIPVGDPILYQHLFWFYSHPAVYLWVLPGFGIISELLPVFSRKPLFGYKAVAMASFGISIVGFLVWAHHMFVAGMTDELRRVFMVATLFVAVPTGVKFFSWAATIWGGKISTPTPMLFALGAISVFLIGGLTGPILATIPTDMYLHDSYWVVGHFHATIFGGFTFPFFAAIYYWYPKATGRMYDERLGKLHFWLMTPGFWLMSLGQMVAGIKGMNRRYADFQPELGIEFVQSLVTLSGLIIGWSVLIMCYNLIRSARKSEAVPVGDNPWGARTPEWFTPSPVPEMNYNNPIEIIGEPYDFGQEDYVRVVASGD